MIQQSQIKVHYQREIKQNQGLLREVNEVLDYLRERIILAKYFYKVFVEDYGVVYPYKNIRVCLCGSRFTEPEIYLLTKDKFDKAYESCYPKPVFLTNEFLDSLVVPQDIIIGEGKEIKE